MSRQKSVSSRENKSFKIEPEDALMRKDTAVSLGGQAAKESKTSLDELVREGARRMLQEAMELEVREYIERRQQMRDGTGRRLVVRNGSLPEREILSGVGPLRIKQPRAHDRREGEKFSSRILPPYMRRLASIDALIPALHLKGISTGDFTEALSAILGDNAAGLSPTNIVRLKRGWEEEYKEWSRRDLSEKRYVYFWADGIHFNVRLEPDRPCMLVIIGTLVDGTKELVAVQDGHRESKESWLEMLRDLENRGLKEGPKLAVGDGALGFWRALEEVFPGTKHQRCWVHKTANVLDKLPKRVQPHAKTLLHEMYLAPTKQDALKAYDVFLKTYQAKYPKACECLRKDKAVLFTFYDFPAEHWLHIRSTNAIESTFATVRHRTRQTKGCGSRLATLTMVFKLATQAEKHWRRINGYKLISKVMEGVEFVDGLLKEAA
jgi:putative transposase